MIKILILGTDDCEKCCLMKRVLPSTGMKWEFLDADADVNERLCEEHRVDELPHILVTSGGRVLLEHIGYIDPFRLKRLIAGFNESKKENDTVTE